LNFLTLRNGGIKQKHREKGGEIYQKIFRVKSWKKLILSGAALYRGAYEVKHITEYSVENVRLWVKESCRSEFCHIVMILPGFLFFLWNSVEATEKKAVKWHSCSI